MSENSASPVEKDGSLGTAAQLQAGAVAAATATPSAASSCVTRRQLILAMTTSAALGAVAATSVSHLWKRFFGSPFMPFWSVLGQVIPPGGIRTTISFGDSVQKLIAAGALDPGKLRARYKQNPGAPPWLEKLIVGPSSEPILLSLETAPHLLKLFWPLGLATLAQFNDKSPIGTSKLSSFASTAGWTLGRAPNGAVYFNKVASLQLTDEQQQRVLQVATSTYRPCCDNSTFYQDCNHGSALLGLIELGAAQGKSTDELYRLSLAANSHWFPEQYAKTALYFALFEGKDWMDVDPKLILGPRFSTLSGWQSNVNIAIQFANFLPRTGQMAQQWCAI